MDAIDKILLRALQEDGRMTYHELAEKTDLTVPAVRDRILKLKERGVIRGVHAVVDAKCLNKDITAFVMIESAAIHYQDLIDYVRQESAIQECHSITGGGSHLLKVRTKNTTSLEKILSKIQRWPGVKGTETHIVLSTFKESTFIDPEETDFER
ncbi:MAG: Lrp/AsnC family transcriptional regulator [Candidatus Marinimicrobia bacterium]|nr:Lrp/AsnC family transcriptional regulator [Candidatus Neomarinimicrobiota bacterium]MDD5582296.1 Lrp/AsnC family transcriptional regulator [Candidatus Neomarinimicrobiota bacterium]